jgi:chorismate mutase/prephenate dehydratase
MTERLEELRETIDSIDRSIVEKLDERAEIVEEIGSIKKEQGLDLYVPGREREILDRLQNLGSGSFPPSSLRTVFREIIATCLNLEKPVSVGYLGPEATFTHSAALKRFGNSTELKPFDSVSETFRQVERGTVDYGIVPIENSSEGAVRHTLDRFLSSRLSICSECYLQIELCLLSGEADISAIDKVYSHGQALSQARSWVDQELPGAKIEETQSTAEAARIAKQERGSAAVASEVAADVYDLSVLSRNIEQPEANYTRFLVLGEESPDPTGDDKTTVAFSVQDKAGALQRIIKPFGEYDINMTKIESRPSPEKTWDYIFFVDFQGHKNETPIDDFLEELRSNSKMFKILGSYPRENPFSD